MPIKENCIFILLSIFILRWVCALLLQFNKMNPAPFIDIEWFLELCPNLSNKPRHGGERIHSQRQFSVPFVFLEEP